MSQPPASIAGGTFMPAQPPATNRMPVVAPQNAPYYGAPGGGGQISQTQMMGQSPAMVGAQPVPPAVALNRPPMPHHGPMKRPAPGANVGGTPTRTNQQQNSPAAASTTAAANSAKKKRKLSDKVIPAQIRELVPESQAYMDLLAFEKKLDTTITRKRLDIQEALKRPMKIKRKLRIFVSHTFYPGKEAESGSEEGTMAQWELRVEGRLADDLPGSNASQQQKVDTSKQPKRKFSSFFKSLVIELDKDIYGPDNHLVEWHRTAQTSETDGFQVKRPGDRNVKCTIWLLLDYQPMKYKLSPPFARLLGLHTETRAKIIEALWQYIKTHRLQDPHERDHVNCDKYLEQIFQCQRIRFMEIPQRLNALLQAPDPVVIHHAITCEGSEQKKTACYDIDVEIDDPVKPQMSQFLLSQQNQQEVQNLDSRIFDTVDQIQQLKTQREFYLGFAEDPQEFIEKWLISQCRDLKTMTETPCQPEAERRSDFYNQLWMDEAVSRYFYNKVQQKRSEIEQALRLGN